MNGQEPIETINPTETSVDPRFGDPTAPPLDWSEAAPVVEAAELWWCTTVRSDGRPHVTPVVAVWVGGKLYFASGADEQKSRNLAARPECVLTTGRNEWDDGLDIVVEGMARRVLDVPTLEVVAAAFSTKYDPDWNYNVDAIDAADPRLEGEDGNRPVLYALEPRVVFGFGKGTPFRQTRWTFG